MRYAVTTPWSPAEDRLVALLRERTRATAAPRLPGEWWCRVVRDAAQPRRATVYLYDEISYWGTSADYFAAQLAELDVDEIELRLNSPGGLAFDGIAIHNVLRAHPASVSVVVDGLAASIASVIAMAGDTVTMGDGAQMMVHNPRGGVVGEASEMRAYADLLDRVAVEVAGFYQRRAGGDAEYWLSKMDAETWYSGPEAVAAGLADGLTRDAADGGDGAQDLRTFDLRDFRYPGRGGSPAPLTHDANRRNRSALVRARHRVRQEAR